MVSNKRKKPLGTPILRLLEAASNRDCHNQEIKLSTSYLTDRLECVVGVAYTSTLTRGMSLVGMDNTWVWLGA